jgi:hypothetical protein
MTTSKHDVAPHGSVVGKTLTGDRTSSRQCLNERIDLVVCLGKAAESGPLSFLAVFSTVLNTYRLEWGGGCGDLNRGRLQRCP